MATFLFVLVEALKEETERLVDPRLTSLRMKVAAILEASLLVRHVVPLYDCDLV